MSRNISWKYSENPADKEEIEGIEKLNTRALFKKLKRKSRKELLML